MDLVIVYYDNGSEANLLPFEVSNREWAVEEAVFPCLWLPVLMSDATVPVHCPEQLQGAAAKPLSISQIGAVIIGTKIGSNQDTLKPENREL